MVAATVYERAAHLKSNFSRVLRGLLVLALTELYYAIRGPFDESKAYSGTLIRRNLRRL